MPECTWKFLTYGALCGLLFRLARKYPNKDGLKILADVELELVDRVIPVDDLGLDVNTVDVVPPFGTHTSAPASSSDVVLFDQAVYGDSPSQCLADLGLSSATEYTEAYQTTPVSVNDNRVPEATGGRSGISNVVLAFFGLLLCIVPTFRSGYIHRPGFSHRVQSVRAKVEVPTAQSPPLDGSSRLTLDDHEHAEHTASVDASEELGDLAENSFHEVVPSVDLVSDTPALVSVPTLDSDTAAVGETSLEDEALGFPITVGANSRDEIQGIDAEDSRVDDITQDKIESLATDDVAEATIGSPGIVSSISDTSMTAEELDQILQEVSINLHIRNAALRSVSASGVRELMEQEN